jgi:signal transduction histidine kinase
MVGTARPPLPRGEPERGAPARRVAAQAAVDPRVTMVLAVLGGRTAEDVAQEWDVAPSLIQRWLRDFLAAGTAVITHRPEPDEARQRDRFLAAFAHEIRTPVAVARGWAMLLAEGDVPDDEVSESHERLSEALTRLSEYIYDVELSAAASLGRTRVVNEPIEVAALCRTLRGNPAVRVGAEVVLHADPRLLSRVLRDLWETAHLEPEPDAVAIDVVESDSWHEIRVVREGVPIAPEVIEALFDPFGANDDATGVTLGLYTARALTVALGGFIGAEVEGRCTVLLARLPREPVAEAEPSGPLSRPDKGEER